MRRLLVERIGEDTVTLSGEQHHRVTRVLRLGRGGRLRVFDGQGREFEAVIESVGRSRALLRLERAVPPLPEPRLRITLFQSIPRGDAMERVVQKCVEIGVAEVVPLITRRTVARPRETAGSVKLARWRKIALHAAEQSGRAWLVPIAAPLRAAEVAPRFVAYDLALVPHQDAAPRLRDVLAAARQPESVAVVIGPEGGFAPDEIERFRAAGARIVSLGARILRSETAGVVAAAIVLYHFGEAG